jgi:hypothetical protein
MRGVSAKNREGWWKTFHQGIDLGMKALHAGKVMGHCFSGFKLQIVNFIDYVGELVFKKPLGELRWGIQRPSGNGWASGHVRWYIAIYWRCNIAMSIVDQGGSP